MPPCCTQYEDEIHLQPIYPEFPNKHSSQKKNQSTEIRRRAEFIDWGPAWCSLWLVVKEKCSNSHELCFKRRMYFLAGHQNLQQKNRLQILWSLRSYNIMSCRILEQSKRFHGFCPRRGRIPGTFLNKYLTMKYTWQSSWFSERYALYIYIYIYIYIHTHTYTHTYIFIHTPVEETFSNHSSQGQVYVRKFWWTNNRRDAGKPKTFIWVEERDLLDH